MQVTTTDGKTFTLTRETATDHQFIDAVDLHTHVYCIGMQRTPATDSLGGFENLAVNLIVDRLSEPALASQAGRQALSALGQLFSLGLSEAAKHGHVSTTATNPQAQEQLAASLVQLQMMLQALRDVVIKQELVAKEICSAHGSSPLLVVESAIVAQGGAQ